MTLEAMYCFIVAGGPGLHLPSKDYARLCIDNTKNLKSPAECYQSMLQSATEWEEDFLIYFHDDVTVHDKDWNERIRNRFKDPQVVAVGMGGATGLANKDLYRKPFNIWNMARSGYCSNQTDAETHGSRFTGSKRVAVLDAFCMAVRMPWLRDRGGWPIRHLTHHCLDLWLACEAARDGKQIWMEGISCTHHGGGTSTKPSYTKAPWLQGGSLEQDHIRPHKWLYKEYRDVLPILV